MTTADRFLQCIRLNRLFATSAESAAMFVFPNSYCEIFCISILKQKKISHILAVLLVKILSSERITS